MKAAREAAATKLAACRRGQIVRSSLKRHMAQHESDEFRAAAVVQTAMRGKAARSELEGDDGSEGQRCRRWQRRGGQQARRHTSTLQFAEAAAAAPQRSGSGEAWTASQAARVRAACSGHSDLRWVDRRILACG